MCAAVLWAIRPSGDTEAKRHVKPRTSAGAARKGEGGSGDGNTADGNIPPNPLTLDLSVTPCIKIKPTCSPWTPRAFEFSQPAHLGPYQSPCS